MKAFRFLFFSLLIFAASISLSQQKEILSPEVDICRLFKDGVKLRKPGTCNQGIVCQNGKSTQGIVCPNGYYSLDSGACVTKRPSDSYCATPCSKTTTVLFVNDKKNCNNWVQCKGSTEISTGSCPTNQLFNQKLQMCTYEDQTTCVATYEFCDVVPKNIPFRDEANCHKYFKCTKTTLSVKLDTVACPTGKYYDAVLGACDKKSEVDCYKHPYPEDVCGTTKIAYHNRFVDDQATCRGYFYCKDLGVGKPDREPIWGQCSVYEFFNPAVQACEQRSHVKCDEDRCDGRFENELEISGKKGCQHYLLCGKNYTKEEYYCGDGKWFDAELSQCTTVKKSYPSCA